MEGPRTSGRTDEAGHYRLQTDNGDDGATVGKYRVLLLDTQSAQPGQRGRRLPNLQPPDKAKLREERLKRLKLSRVPRSWGRFDATPLRTEVRPGQQVIDLEVK
jgi:hypothetical protein